MFAPLDRICFNRLKKHTSIYAIKYILTESIVLRKLFPCFLAFFIFCVLSPGGSADLWSWNRRTTYALVVLDFFSWHAEVETKFATKIAWQLHAAFSLSSVDWRLNYVFSSALMLYPTKPKIVSAELIALVCKSIPEFVLLIYNVYLKKKFVDHPCSLLLQSFSFQVFSETAWNHTMASFSCMGDYI